MLRRPSLLVLSSNREREQSQLNRSRFSKDRSTNVVPAGSSSRRRYFYVPPRPFDLRAAFLPFEDGALVWGVAFSFLHHGACTCLPMLKGAATGGLREESLTPIGRLRRNLE